MTRLGDFLKCLATIITLKVTKIFSDFLSFLKSIPLIVTSSVIIFGQLLVEIGLLYNQTSGHTVHDILAVK